MITLLLLLFKMLIWCQHFSPSDGYKHTLDPYFCLTAVLFSQVLKAIAGIWSGYLAVINRQTPLFFKAMNFYVSLCVADRGEECRAKQRGVRVINHCIDGDLVRIVVSDGWPITLYAPSNHQSPREFSSARLSSAAQSIFIKGGLSPSQQPQHTPSETLHQM